MGWVQGGIAAAGALGSFFGSKKKNKSSETTKLPPWLDAASQDAVAKAQGISKRPYTPYQGARVAPLNETQGRAFDIAGTTEEWKPGINEATSLTKEGGKSFLDADINAYMNPFIKGAIDPAAREMHEEYLREINRNNAAAVSRGAFGGRRQELTNADTYEKFNQGVGDLYATGYAGAFDRGASLFAGDRDAAGRTGAQLADLTALTNKLNADEFEQLLLTGGLEQELAQRQLDVNYSDFLEERDWDIRNLNVLLSAIGGTPYNKTTESVAPSGNRAAQAVGAGATIYGLLGAFNKDTSNPNAYPIA